MFDAGKLFKERLSLHIKDLARYTKYIFNGHLAIAMLFLIAALAYYYQAWLAQLPENFPAALIIGIAFGLLVTHSPMRTLLKDADLVFLTVVEKKMAIYFRRSLSYSFLMQIYLVFLVAAALGPLYTTSFPNRESPYLLIVAIILLFKFANLIATWWMLKIRDLGVRRRELAVRTLLNLLVFYFLINGKMLFASIATILFVILFLSNYSLAKKQPHILWDVLIEKDQNSMQVFYRFANMFADVPQLKTKVKKRQWLVTLLTKNIPFANKYSFDYLYWITFVRSGDYLGMYFRLLIVGSLFIYLIPNSLVQVLFVILFVYLSSFQMMTLYQHHRTIMWLDIYPVDEVDRKQALIKMIYQLSIVQTIIYAVLFLFEQAYAGFFLALLAGILFTVLFINGYVKKRLVS